MGKFSLLTTLILDSGGYTKGIKAASKSTQELGSKIQSASEGLTSTMSSMGGMVGSIGGAVESLAGAATGIGLVTAAVGLLVTALKQAKENMDLYLASANKAELGTMGFSEDAEKLRKETRQRARGAVRVNQTTITDAMLSAAKIYNDIQKETDESKKTILQTTLDQIIAEYNISKSQLETNLQTRNDLRGRQAKIVLEEQLKKLLLEQSIMKKGDIDDEERWLKLEDELIKKKSIITNKSESAGNKQKALNEYEQLSIQLKQEKITDIDEELALSEKIYSLTGQQNLLDEAKRRAAVERAKVEKEYSEDIFKSLRLESKVTKEQSAQTAEIEKQKKLRGELTRDALTAEQELLIKQQTTEKDAALKTREFKYNNDISAAKEKYAGMTDLNKLLKNLETIYLLDIAEIKNEYNEKDIEESKKIEEEKLKKLEEVNNKRLELEKRLLDDKRSLVEADYITGSINEKQYLLELMNLELVNTENTEAKKMEIKARYAKELKNLEIQNLQNMLSYVSSSLSTMGTLYEAEKNKEIQAAGNNRAKIEQIERKFQRKMQKIAISEAFINMAAGVMQAWGRKQPLWMKIIESGLVVATGVAQIAKIKSQSFASGGIVSGPTNALIGEYPSAKNNPEVVAPLSKLNELLNIGNNGTVEFRIEGTTLVGVLNNQYRKLNSYR